MIAALLLMFLFASTVPVSFSQTSTRAEKRRYTAEDIPEGGPRFEDYHKLLDHYYTVGMTEDELYSSLRETLIYRLSLPQRYYEGAGYIPGVDEGTIPTVDDGNGGRREITEEEYWQHREEDEEKVRMERQKKGAPQ